MQTGLCAPEIILIPIPIPVLHEGGSLRTLRVFRDLQFEVGKNARLYQLVVELLVEIIELPHYKLFEQRVHDKQYIRFESEFDCSHLECRDGMNRAGGYILLFQFDAAAHHGETLRQRIEILEAVALGAVDHVLQRKPLVQLLFTDQLQSLLCLNLHFQQRHWVTDRFFVQVFAEATRNLFAKSLLDRFPGGIDDTDRVDKLKLPLIGVGFINEVQQRLLRLVEHLGQQGGQSVQRHITAILKGRLQAVNAS